METEPFSETFGPKTQRKRPKLDVGTFEELGKVGTAAAERAEDSAEGPSGITAIFRVVSFSLIKKLADPQQVLVGEFQPVHADYIEPIFAKGTSRRIYGELYKVIDSSDVILHILDARDPLGTMCESVLDYLKKEKAHKQVVLVINKCDLVPNWVTVSPRVIVTPTRSTNILLIGKIYTTPYPKVPYNRLSCVTQSFVRKGFPHSTPSPVLTAPLG